MHRRNTYHKTATEPSRRAVQFDPISMINRRGRMSTRLRLASRATFMVNLLRRFSQQVPIVAPFRTFLSFFRRRQHLVPAFQTIRLKRRHAVFVVIRRSVTTFNSFRHVITYFKGIFRRLARFFNKFRMMTNTIRFRSSQLIGDKSQVSTRRNVLETNIFNTRMVKVINNRR